MSMWGDSERMGISESEMNLYKREQNKRSCGKGMEKRIPTS